MPVSKKKIKPSPKKKGTNGKAAQGGKKCTAKAPAKVKTPVKKVITRKLFTSPGCGQLFTEFCKLFDLCEE